ncbi:MAG: aminopeptidase [Fidelibacterota bacterium]
MVKIERAIEIILVECINLKKGEVVLIITDEFKRNIGFLFSEKAREFGSESILIEIPPLRINGEEPPDAVAAIMKEVDVIIAPTEKSITHTDARRDASSRGARTITLPGITRNILERCVDVDYSEMKEITKKLADLLTIGKEVRIETDLNTDLFMNIKGQKGIPDTGLVHRKGDISNLPAGEAFLSPVEGSTRGRLVIDGSMGNTGLIRKPIRMIVKNGFAIRIFGEREARIIRRQIRGFGKMARNIAELGIGTNYRAKISGNVLEDEKVMGTIHVAIGNNVSMGGTVNVNCHLDGIVRDPTLYIDDKLILKNGKLMI